MSKADKNQLAKYLIDKDKRNLIQIIENGFPTTNDVCFLKKHSFTQNRETCHKIYYALFIGSKHTEHNIQSVKEIQKIARAMRTNDNVRFVVVGTNWEIVKESNFENLGYVADFTDVLSRTDFAFLPMQSGGGTKLKTLRFIYSKIPLICTKYAVQGLGLKKEVHYIPLSVENPMLDFINILNRPSLDQDLARVAQNAISATRHLSWDTIVKKLNRIITNHISK